MAFVVLAFAKIHYVFSIIILAYLVLVRSLRYKRVNKITYPFENGKRPLSSMTTPEAFDIMRQLYKLEFPYTMNKARSVALLKVRIFHSNLPNTFVTNP